MSKHFFYKLLGISCIIAVLEICGLGIAIIGQTGTKVFSSFKAEQLPPIFIVQMLVFTGIVVGLHYLVLIYSWLSARALLAKGILNQKAAENFGLLVLLISWIAIFLLNNAFIPRSIFSYWGEYAIGPINQISLALIFSTLALLPLAIGLMMAIKTVKIATITAITIVSLTLFLLPKPEPIESSAQPGKPNIIIIGIDSFRPEYLNAPELMPNLSSIIADSAVFTQVYTPLARTFPSWVSMLSGLHPLETGARINLTDPNMINRDSLVTWQLLKAGYHTILATDERRFSNLDEAYGFDTVIGPSPGAADFVLGMAGDLPLVNLVASTTLGELLFPYLHNNRAVSRLYRPELFARRLARELSTTQKGPLFLMTHLCLPHWPYDWATAPNVVKDTLKPKAGREEKLNNALKHRTGVYEATLQEVDQQIAILLNSLQTAGHLDNAIVVILSDHGEGLGRPEDGLVTSGHPEFPSEARRRAGHGTNIFALDQHKTFMSYKRFGGKQYPNGERKQRFASYDFKPTLLALLDLPQGETSQAVSLTPWIWNAKLDELDRSIFIETGFHVPAIDTFSFDPGDVLSEGSSYYSFRNDGRLVIKPTMMDRLIRNKQRGIIKGQLLLGQVPVKAENDSIRYEWILTDIKGNGAVSLSTDNFTSACQSQCLDMLAELLDFYGEELAIDTWPAYTRYSLPQIAANRSALESTVDPGQLKTILSDEPF